MNKNQKPLVNKHINELIRNELIFSSSSNNSSNFGNVIRKCNESSSVDLPDETVSNSSGSSLCFDKHNRMTVSGPFNKINNRKNKRSNGLQNFKQANANRYSDSSEKSLNSMTISDLDTKNSNQPESKLLRKKFIKCILREDVYVLKNANENSRIDLMSIRDKHRNTLMHIACGFGRLKSVQTLMKLYPKMIEQLDDKGHTPVDVAIKHGQLDVVKWLLVRTNRLQSDANLNSIDLNQTYDASMNLRSRSCLHLASKHGENEILRFILNEMHKLQLSLDIQDMNGNTACHLAAKYGHLDCLQTLVEFNCDITIVNKNGHTPCFMAEYHGNNECVHYLMIVETCINLSIKVVRLSRRLRETKSNNEILKAQMDEAIAINNDFINQRENVMNISLDLMQRQINDLESKINYEIEKFNMENRNLREKLDILNSQLKSFTNSNDKLIEANNYSNAINNKNIVIQPNLEAVRHDLANTKQVCAKVIQMDQKKLDSIKSRFEEIKTNLDSSSSSQDIIKSKCSGNGNQVSSCDTDIIENKEHFEILRKMYQETTHKLMIFRNALKEHTKANEHQRPKTATGTRVSESNFDSKVGSSTSSINSNNSVPDNRQIKSSTPTLMHTSPTYHTIANTIPINNHNNQNFNTENYIEYSSGDETLSENEYDYHKQNQNVLEEIGEDDDEDEDILLRLNSKRVTNTNRNVNKKPGTYLQASDEEEEEEGEQNNSSAPSIQTVIENHKQQANGNNYVNDGPYQQQRFIIEEIEEKIEEHEELEEQMHVINQYDYQSDIRNRVSIKQK